MALAEIVAPLEVVDYTSDVAETYGAIRSFLKKKGRVIGPLDLLIAAHALRLQVTLVTNNVHEFKRIRGLRIENWTQQAAHLGKLWNKRVACVQTYFRS